MIETTRAFDYDPLTGKRETFHYLGDGKFAIEANVDVTDLVEHNKYNFNTDDTGFRDDLHRVASLPLIIYMELKKNGTLDDPKRFKAWLNDRDNRAFRTKAGRV